MNSQTLKKMDKLRLLSGLPIDMGFYKLYPPKLIEVADIGEDVYKSYLASLVFNKEDVKFENISEKDLESISTFDIIMVNCNSNKDYRCQIESALRFFIKEEVHFSSNGNVGLFYMGEILDERFITRDNFEDLKAALRQICCIEAVEDEYDLNIEDEEEKKRIIEIKKRQKKAKQRELAENGMSSDDLELSDLISALCGASFNLSITDVWDLTMYQFYDQFKRVKLVDDYKIQVQSAMAGAEVDEMTHWISKI